MISEARVQRFMLAVAVTAAVAFIEAIIVLGFN
jgi:hypothetical protein